MYYAVITKNAAFPAPVVGWEADQIVVTRNPDGTVSQAVVAPQPADGYALVKLPGLTDEQWNDPSRYAVTRLVTQDGVLSDAPPPQQNLKEQAQEAFQVARRQFSDLQMMGETFGPKMQAYMQALNAIVKGTDTTSSALPAAPSDPTQ